MTRPPTPAEAMIMKFIGAFLAAMACEWLSARAPQPVLAPAPRPLRMRRYDGPFGVN